MPRATLPLLLFCTLLSGCIGVIPVPERTATQQGRIPGIDLHFIAPGHTTINEVQEKLKATDSGFDSDQFFIGRWRRSKLAGWIALGTPAGGGGVAAERFWKNMNLIVKFDENHLVEAYEVVPDSLLMSKLAPVAHEHSLLPREDMEGTILFGAGEIPIRLVLSQDAMEFEELTRLLKFKHRPQYHYTVPVEEFRGVAAGRNQENVDFVETTFHFADDLRNFHGPHGKSVSIQLTVTQLITVLSYASRHSHRAMP